VDFITPESRHSENLSARNGLAVVNSSEYSKAAAPQGDGAVVLRNELSSS